MSLLTPTTSAPPYIFVVVYAVELFLFSFMAKVIIRASVFPDFSSWKWREQEWDRGDNWLWHRGEVKAKPCTYSVETWAGCH